MATATAEKSSLVEDILKAKTRGQKGSISRRVNKMLKQAEAEGKNPNRVRGALKAQVKRKKAKHWFLET
jgi:hypothetical protein